MDTVKNPGDPATKKQKFALYCIYGGEWRNVEITRKEASEKIAAGKKSSNKGSNKNQKTSNGKKERPARAANARAASLVKSKKGKDKAINGLYPKGTVEREFEDYILSNLDRVKAKVEEELGIESIVSDDPFYNGGSTKKRGKLIGGGCGFVRFRYDGRKKKLQKVARAFAIVTQPEFTNYLVYTLFDMKTVRKYRKDGTPLEALFHQSLAIKMCLANLAENFARERGYAKENDYFSGFGWLD
jgi:hypothetical protein